MFLLLSNLYIECYDEVNVTFSAPNQLTEKQKQGVYSVLRAGITNLHRMVGGVEKKSVLQTKLEFLEEKQMEVNQVLRQVLPLLVSFNPGKRDTRDILLEVDAIPQGLADGVVFQLDPTLFQLPAPVQSAQLQFPPTSTSTCNSTLDLKSDVLVWRIGFKIHIALRHQVFTTRYYYFFSF